MSNIIYKEDVNNVKTLITGFTEKDIDDNTQLLALINKYVEESESAGLTGDGYDATRRYLKALYVSLLERRKSINSELASGVASATSSMNSFMGSDSVLDDSKLSDLQSSLSKAQSSLNECNRLINQQTSSGEAADSFLYSNRRLYGEQVNYLNKQIKKLIDLPTTDASIYTSNILPVENLVIQFASDIDGIECLNAEVSTEATDTGGTTGSPSGGTTGSPSGGTTGSPSGGTTGSPSGGTTGSPSGGTTGSSSGGSSGGTVVTPETPTNNKTTEEIRKSIIAAASSLIGMTSAQLAADTSNGVYSIDNYQTDEIWNAKFVSDVIRRDPTAAKLLEEYYSNTKYSDPYNSADELLDYSMNSDSNIEFNWSDGSIKTIADYNKESGFDEVTYKSYTPQEGDVVFLDSNDTDGTFKGNTSDVSSVDRVGIVESVSTVTDADGNKKTVVTVIEGDSNSSDPNSSTVVRKTYDLDSKEILGYGTVKDYDEKTNTSNNLNGTQNGIKDPIEQTKPDDSSIYLKDGDSVGNVNGETGATVDSEGVQRDADGNVIGETKLDSNSDGSYIVNEDDIPSSDTKIQAPEEVNETVDMDDYNKKTGEEFSDFDSDQIDWDWENIDN